MLMLIQINKAGTSALNTVQAEVLRDVEKRHT